MWTTIVRYSPNSPTALVWRRTAPNTRLFYSWRLVHLLPRSKKNHGGNTHIHTHKSAQPHDDTDCLSLQLVLLATMKNSTWHNINKVMVMISCSCVGDRCRPQLQSHIPDPIRRRGPWDPPSFPPWPSDWRAVSSQSVGLWGFQRVRSHIHVHRGGRRCWRNHASWISISHCQNHGGCVFVGVSVKPRTEA